MWGRLLGLCFAIAGATSFSQLPEFTQQYAQRLGGHVDELRLFVETFDRDARSVGQSRLEALATLHSNSDPFVAKRGDSAEATINRFEQYRQVHAQLEQAAPFERIWIFATTFDSDIAWAAWARFKPALPLTLEGAVHAGAGLLTGLGLGWICVAWMRVGRRRVDWKRDRGGRKAARRLRKDDTKTTAIKRD